MSQPDFQEDFSGKVLDPAWRVVFLHNPEGIINVQTWSGGVADGVLRASDIQPFTLAPSCISDVSNRALVAVERDVPLLVDFDVAATISWDSGGLGSARQAVRLELVGDNGSVVCHIGAEDRWTSTTGAVVAAADSPAYRSPAGSLPLAGTATVRLARSDGFTGAYWNDQPLTGSSSFTTQIRTIRLLFEYWPCPGATFGTLEFDSVTLVGTCPPVVRVQPMNTGSCAGGTVQFRTAALGAGPLTHQWRRDGDPLEDGPTASGSVVSGATTPVLTIESVSASDAGAYSCEITGACDTISTSEAVFALDGCRADFNGSGTINSTDISAYLQSWLAALADGDPNTDMDCNGQINSNDISNFLQHWIAAVTQGC